MSMSKKANVTRRQAREWALQMLFIHDHNPEEDIESVIETFWNQQLEMMEEDEANQALEAGKNPFSVIRWEEAPAGKPKPRLDRLCPPKLRDFAEHRVRGVVNDIAAIDEAIGRYTEHWEIYRMGAVERNVLRMAYFELRDCKDVPAPVVLNEAIDLAKYFSNTNAGRFVNGILDKMRMDLRQEEIGKPYPPRKKR